MVAYSFHAVRDDRETEIIVEYTITAFIPAQGPSYASGGQPAEGGEVEIVGCTETASEEVVDLTDAEVERITVEIAEQHVDDDDYPEPVDD